MTDQSKRRRIFFGGAIQGLSRRGERSPVYSALLATIKEAGFLPASEHTATGSMAETAAKLEESLGPLPPPGLARNIYVRDRMIELVESDIAGAIFEVSTPSLGTGVEIAHAYLRPRMGLPAIPILCLYEKDHWANGLSSMIRGITPRQVPELLVHDYTSVEAAVGRAREFLQGLI